MRWCIVFPGPPSLDQCVVDLRLLLSRPRLSGPPARVYYGTAQTLLFTLIRQRTPLPVRLVFGDNCKRGAEQVLIRVEFEV